MKNYDVWGIIRGYLLFELIVLLYDSNIHLICIWIIESIFIFIDSIWN